MIEQTSLIVENRRKQGELIYEDGRIYFKFGFWKALNAEIKCMEGWKWHGYDKPTPRKIWSVQQTQRNLFQLEYLKGNNPYKRYDEELKLITPTRDILKKHQILMLSHAWQRRHCVLAADMGTGKTLVSIELAEKVFREFGDCTFLYIAPNSALISVRLEYLKWNAQVKPEFLTYSAAVKFIENWQPGRAAPLILILDESSRIKNKDAQRSKAARHMADAMRQEYGYNSFILEMSGTPSPKSPIDWWNQAEIACPGFLKEGHPNLLKRNLAIIKDVETELGGRFPKLIAWKKGDVCNICGLKENEQEHTDPTDLDYHKFNPCDNEVERLYRRLSGLVLVVLKKDCLDLPPLVYEKRYAKTTDIVLRAAKMISRTSPRAITALHKLRELSDGFQYIKDEEGKVSVEHTDSPKDDLVKDLLDEYSDDARIIFYAGFTASIHKLTALCKSEGWEVIQVSEGKWKSDFDEPAAVFQDKENYPQKIAFVAHPKSAGMGLTLHASSVAVYYSNSFDGEDRMQSKNRIHRLGMGGTAKIIDLINLPSDELVCNNLEEKETLQSITLGDLSNALERVPKEN